MSKKKHYDFDENQGGQGGGFDGAGGAGGCCGGAADGQNGGAAGAGGGQNCGENAENAEQNAQQFSGEDFANGGFENGATTESNELSAEDQISLLQIQVAKMHENLMREAADFENLKKRLAREKESAVSFANESFARELLAVFDALEAALAVPADEQNEGAAQFRKGVENIKSVLLAAFGKFGISEIASEGEFDPAFHNALNYIEAPGVASGQIAAVLQKGFMYHERVLRAAMVLVAK